MPKTIDNDLDLPAYVDTFEIPRRRGTSASDRAEPDGRREDDVARWCLVIAMGRTGHLALGIGKAAGATVTLIPEEFWQIGGPETIVDTIVGSIVKRLSDGRQYGVAVLAEGMLSLNQTIWPRSAISSAMRTATCASGRNRFRRHGKSRSRSA